MNSSPPIQNLKPPPKPKNPPPSSQQQQQQIHVFNPVLSSELQPRYVNSIQQAPQAPVMKTMPENQHAVSMDLSHHMTTPSTNNNNNNNNNNSFSGSTTTTRWNGYDTTEQTKNFSLSAEAIQTHAEKQAQIQQNYKENQARNQQKSQLRQRRVQAVRKIASVVLPRSMSTVDYEGGQGEIILETKAREIWMTVGHGVRLAAWIVLGVLVIWIGFTILFEYGAEARMLTYVDSELHRPKLLSKLNPNFARISDWIKHQAPAYFGNLKQKSTRQGLDSVIQTTTMMDPSEWGVGNWFSRLLGRLFFHKGLQQVERNLLLRDLDLSLREAARETKLSCLCAAHVGVTLHAVLCQDTFMLEPVLETASSHSKATRIRDGVLSMDITEITEFTHDVAAHVDYISKTGRKARHTLGEDKTRCVTYCTKLAQRNI